MGETGMAMQFRDGVSGKPLGECRDTGIGRKHAVHVNTNAVGAAQTWANGYLKAGNRQGALGYAKQLAGILPDNANLKRLVFKKPGDVASSRPSGTGPS